MAHSDHESPETNDLNPASAVEEAGYGASPELVVLISEALDHNLPDAAKAVLSPMHAADVADVIEMMKGDRRRLLVEVLRQDFDPEILGYLDDTVREEVAEQLGTQDLAAALSDLESDDALSIIEDLDQTQQREILRAISAEERAILEEVLTYPEDSAGRLMQREIAVVPSFWTVGETLNYLGKSSDLPDSFYEVYVVNPKHQPVGSVPLNRLLRHKKNASIESVMDHDVRRISVTTDREKVAQMFHHYGLVSTPVVDAAGRIVGMITVDDVVDVIAEEATEDIMHMAGISESDFHDPVAQTFVMRFRWLFVTLVNTLLAVTVISQFQKTISHTIALAVLMPISAAMGGNSGIQVVTIMVRALATRDLRLGNIGRTLGKELMVGLLNAAVFASLLGLICGLIYRDLRLSLVLSGALIFNLLWAALAGTLIPVIIDRLRMDPALSAGPLLTTTTDTLGFAIFLGLATLFLS